MGTADQGVERTTRTGVRGEREGIKLFFRTMEFDGGVARTQGLVVDKWFLAIECRFVGDRPGER